MMPPFTSDTPAQPAANPGTDSGASAFLDDLLPRTGIGRRIWDYAHFYFLTNFCYYLLLPLTLAALVILGLGISDAFGADKLVFEIDPLRQFVVGVSLGLTWLFIVHAGYLLLLQDVSEEVLTKQKVTFRTYFFNISFCFLAVVGVIMLAAYFVDAANRLTSHTVLWRFQPHWTLLVPIGIGVVWGVFAYLSVALDGAWVAMTEFVGHKWSEMVPSAQASSQRRGSRIAVVALLAANWVFLCWQAFPDAVEPGWTKFVLILGIAAVALLLTFVDRFSTLLLFLTLEYLATYATVTWLWSNTFYVVGWIAIPVAALFIRFSRKVLFPESSPAWENFFYRNAKSLPPTARVAEGAALTSEPRERILIWDGFLSFVLTATFFFSIMLTDELFTVAHLSSPVMIVCFLVVVIVAIYGFLNYLIRRAFPFVILTVAFLAILGGIPPHKFRFPDLAEEYQSPINLVEAAKHDNATAETLKNAEIAYVAALEDKSKKVKTPEYADAVTVALEKKADLLKAWQDGATNRLRPLQISHQSLEDDPITKELSKAYREKSPLLATADFEWKEKPLIIITVSGGGLRSAAWTYWTLASLEMKFRERFPNNKGFPYHIRMVTGASGGMLGAAHYVSTLPEPGATVDLEQRRLELAQGFEDLTHDHLTPIMAQAAFGDLPCLLSPWPLKYYDRGRALEDSWTRKMPRLKDTFETVRKGEKDGWRPSLVFAPMMVEDGRRLIVSNLDLQFPLSNDGNLLNGNNEIPRRSHNYSLEGVELFRMFPEATRKVSLATAVRMSASFPFFSPATSVPTSPRRRVVDAGYYDNYGVSLAASWLFSNSNQEWIEKNVRCVALIQIRDGLEDDDRQLKRITGDRSTNFSRCMEELTSPLEGLNQARVGSSSFRNDGQLELLSTFMRKVLKQSRSTLPSYRFFTVVNLEFPEQASLSWYLSASEKKNIQRPFENWDQMAQDEQLVGTACEVPLDPHESARRAVKARIEHLFEWWELATRKQKDF